MEIMKIGALLLAAFACNHGVEAGCPSGWSEASTVCYYISTEKLTLGDARRACEAFSVDNGKLILYENVAAVLAAISDVSVYPGRYRVEGYQKKNNADVWTWYENNPTQQELVVTDTVNNMLATRANLMIKINEEAFYGDKERDETVKYICQSDLAPTSPTPTTTIPTTTPCTTTTPTTTTPTTTTPTTTTPTTTTPTTTTPTTTTPTTTTPTTTTPTTTTPTTTTPTTTTPTTTTPTTTTPTTTTPTTTTPTTTTPTTTAPTTTTSTTTTPTTTTPTTTTPTTTTSTTALLTTSSCLDGWTYLSSMDICYYLSTEKATLGDARRACEASSAPDAKLCLYENAMAVYNDLDNPTSLPGKYRLEGFQKKNAAGVWTWYENQVPNHTELTINETVNRMLPRKANLMIKPKDGLFYGDRHRYDLVKYICQSSPN